MVQLLRNDDKITALLRFGAGVNAASNPSRIADNESAYVTNSPTTPPARNYDIKLDSGSLRPRKPFDLVATAPNAGEIRGFGELIKTDGSVDTLVQAADRVYLWDGGGQTTPPGVAFDGSNDEMTRGADLSGLSPSKVGTFSAWFRFRSAGGILRNDDSRFSVALSTSGVLLNLQSNIGATLLNVTTPTALSNDSEWHHYMASWDLKNNLLNIYLDGRREEPGFTIIETNVDYTAADWQVGRSSSAFLNGDLAEIYFNAAEYVDLLLAVNRAKFITPAGRYVSLGSNGGGPTGTQPEIYFNGDSTNFQTNAGSGGNFSVSGGGLAAASARVADFIFVGSVGSDARLRGNRHSTSQPDDTVVITDLALAEVVKTWDGATFQDLAHNLGVEFKAKYCVFDRERAIFGNVEAPTPLPHVIAASSRGSITTLDVTNRPSSSLSSGDAFQIPMPDLKPINGLIQAFGFTTITTENGQFWRMTGDTALDFDIAGLYRESEVVGVEAVAYIGNDILYGRHGRIDTLVGTEAFGDVETDDVSRWIAPLIENVKSWEIIYNPRLNRAYCFSDDPVRLYVFAKSLYDPFARLRSQLADTTTPRLSPWMIWETTFGDNTWEHTAAAMLKRTTDGLDVVYFGDTSGRIFMLEGEGRQDGGTATINVRWQSGLIELPGDFNFSEFRGYVHFRQHFAVTLTLRLEHQGIEQVDQDHTIALPALTTIPVWGGGSYWGGGNAHWGALNEGKLAKFPFPGIGRSSAFQVRLDLTGDDGFDIHEIGLSFNATSP